LAGRRSRGRLLRANELLPEPLRALDERLARLLAGAGPGLEGKVEASMEAFRLVARAVEEGVAGLRGPLAVMFSGGKDSLVVLDLAHRALGRRRYVAVYIEIPGNTHEENIAYARRVAEMYGLEPGKDFLHLRREGPGFYELVAKWGWPGPGRRWCMTTFKTSVVNKHLRGMVTATGVKAGDSGWRRSWARAGVLGRIPGWRTIFFKPILHWTTGDVMEYIETRGLPLNPLYRKLGGSANCVYCPYNANPEYYERLRALYPHWWARLTRAEASVARGKPFYQGPRRRLGFADLIASKPAQPVQQAPTYTLAGQAGEAGEATA
jgi:3'-phosphoadenosine 5'-phosphosulfate sulfotransferase (PAPS reductase)/FAD synthetase